MRFALAFTTIAAVVVSTLAQDTPPACALQCLITATADPTSLGKCRDTPTDNACLCTEPAFISATTACIQSSCTNPADLAAANTFAQNTCASAGVTLTSSGAASPTSTSPSGSSSGSSAASTTSARTSASSASPSPTGNGASMNGVNAFAGVAAIGFVALVL